MNTNKKYKASLFSMLFNDPVILRELYCAIEGVSLPTETPVTINTLSDVLFMDRVNDISFEIGDRLVILIEHQSSINPNMAFRLLLYITRIFEKIIDKRKIYSSQKLTIPRPEFFVLYNGVKPFPKEAVLKLSDMFPGLEPLGLPEKSVPALELIVRVININEGENEEIVKKCRTLSEYSAFVAKVREYEKEGNSWKDSIKKAVIFCNSNDIMKEFLEKNATEVINMLYTEWDWDEALEVRFEEGIDKGLTISAQNALADGFPIETVQRITGLDIKVIKSLQQEKR